MVVRTVVFLFPPFKIIPRLLDSLQDLFEITTKSNFNLIENLLED